MPGILDGIRVLDSGTVLAAPGMSALLSDFGAEVIKVEMPGVGDPLRTFSPLEQGQGLTSKVTNRGKKSVTINLATDEGREVYLDLVRECDVVVMNYRLPALKKWRIDYDDLLAVKEDIIMMHFTGYGRTGPYAERPGFARVSEAFIGLTYTTGYPDRPPVPSGYAMADATGGVYGAFSIMLALFERQRSGQGQLIDLSLYESLAKTLDAMYIGAIEGHAMPERSGTINPSIAPHDIYEMGDGEFVSLPASTQSMFVRLCSILQCERLVHDERFVDNQQRVAHREELDTFLKPKLQSLRASEFLDLAHAAGIAASRINTPLDFVEDAHVKARGTFEKIWDEGLGRDITMQSVVPRFSRTPGSLQFSGQQLGQSTNEVLQKVLEYTPEKIEVLKSNGTV